MRLREFVNVVFFGMILSFSLVFLYVFDFLPFNIFIFSILAVLVFLLALKKIRFVFWFFVLFLPFESFILSPSQIPFSFRAFQIFAFAVLGAIPFLYFSKELEFKFLSLRKICLLCKVFKKKCKISRGVSFFNRLDFFVFIFPVFAFLGTLNAVNRAVSIKMTVITVSFVAIYWMIRNFLQSEESKFQAFVFAFLGSIPVMLFAFYQALAHKMGWPDFEFFDARVNSVFVEPDWLGVYLSFLVAVILSFKFHFIKNKSKNNLGNFDLFSFGANFFNLYLFCIFFVLFLTVARSAWLGFAGVVGIYLLAVLIFGKKLDWKNFFRESLIVSIIIALGVGIIWQTNLSTFHFFNRAASSFSGKQLITVSCKKGSELPTEIENVEVLESFSCRHIDLEEIESEKGLGKEIKEVYRSDPNVGVRKNIYATIWGEFKVCPVLGRGIGSSSEILGVDDHGNGLNASNIFLEVMFSMGILGLICFSIFVLGPVILALKKLWIIWKKKKNPHFYLIFIVLSTVAIVIPNLFNSGLFLAFFWFWLAVVIDLVYDKKVV